MRFVSPDRAVIEEQVFSRPPLSHWNAFGGLLRAAGWPAIADLNRSARAAGLTQRFVAQTRELLADGLHYEQRVAARGEIATRECNWHDLLNAMVWLRFAPIKSALNARQVAQIAVAGPKRRTRAQCALTHFDEAGVIVLLGDPRLLALWDAHDWRGLFLNERDAWGDGRIEAIVFGHALLEHALRARQFLVGKAIVLAGPGPGRPGMLDDASLAAVAAAIGTGAILNDPQELRPLPLSGIPGWDARNDADDFYASAPCFRPLRPGRRYSAPPLPVASAGA